jgi:hypothetical protein
MIFISGNHSGSILLIGGGVDLKIMGLAVLGQCLKYYLLHYCDNFIGEASVLGS